MATGVSASIESVIEGTNGLVKNGGGTLTLTAANLYTGATTVAEGTLVASKEFTNATAVSVASGATLRIDSARTDWPMRQLVCWRGHAHLQPRCWQSLSCRRV